jgi:hypothetical protein
MYSLDARLLENLKRHTRQVSLQSDRAVRDWHESEVSRAWAKLQETPQQCYKRYLKKQRIILATYLFRFGFASVFMINALIAYVQPNDFLNLLHKSQVMKWLGDVDWMIPLIIINDLALGLMILFAPKAYRPYVYAWTGLWFLAITVIKLTALNG